MNNEFEKWQEKCKESGNKRNDYLTWDEYFMAIAKLSSKRSKDPNTQVGACIVSNDNRILSIGYNGAPNGFEDENFPWARDGEKIYTTMPLGMIIVRDEILITISQVRINSVYKVLSENKFGVETDKKSRFTFQILYCIAQDYIRYLTYINRDLDKFENKMLKSMSNKELLKMMTFEKTMVYFNASVKGNQVVLEKLNKGKVLPLYDEDEDILEDTLIENRQAIEMIQTYSEILNGIVEMFGTVVSNNLNTVMKWLTSITLVISVPTMIASFLGMNVDFPFNTSTIGFYGVIIISILVTVVITFILRKRDLL